MIWKIKKIFISRDVVFYKNTYPYHSHEDFSSNPIPLPKLIQKMKPSDIISETSHEEEHQEPEITIQSPIPIAQLTIRKQ